MLAIMRLWFATAVVVLLAGCGHAKQSITLYEKGDYAGSLRAADEGLSDHPDDNALWGMRIRAALALGDGAAVAKAYGDYVAKRGDDDHELLRDLIVGKTSRDQFGNLAFARSQLPRALGASEFQRLVNHPLERQLTHVPPGAVVPGQ